MPEFPHLPLPKKISALYKHRGQKIEKKVSPTTLNNLQNRPQHARTLKRDAGTVLHSWQQQKEARAESELPKLPNEDIVPVLLQVDVNEFKPESLYSFGIEVIAEEEDGYIIGAAGDNFKSLKDKIDQFVKAKGKFQNKAAQLWNIIQGQQWRVDYIVSEELKTRWDNIGDEEVLVVDVSIACFVKTPQTPSRLKNESEKAFTKRYNKWLERKQQLEIEKEDIEEARQNEFKEFVNALGAEILSAFVSNDDSFCCRIKLSGSALKDLVFNYQYLFDVTEFDDLTYINEETGEEAPIEADFLPPNANDPKVCIIDSGIQEAHRLISDAIIQGSSKCYLPGVALVTDEVNAGGHGTKIAGNILFGSDIPKNGVHKHTAWVQNARILDQHCCMPRALFPPELMKNIAEDFQDTKVFNLSVNATRPCKVVHMSEWAASIDLISHQENRLFIVSTGNIKRTNPLPSNPGISEHLQNGRPYPTYLYERISRISNPAQSCFALTVGSVAHTKYEDIDRESFAGKDQASSLTRTGPGLWGMIKPDVVEYGGDFVKEKSQNPLITTLPESSIEVVKTTAGAGNAIGHDLGTSYSAGKVSHIVTKILNEIPGASPNMIRCLVAQSARLPSDTFRAPTMSNIRTHGYGIANKRRATENYRERITLTAESNISAKQAEIYTLTIPNEIRKATHEFDVLIEVAMAFTAKPRRTRRGTRCYLSTWVDWKSSKFQDTYNQFKTRVTQYSEGDEIEDPVDDAKNIPWVIRENSTWGSVKGLRRHDSSLQKDWTILKAFQLPETFSIAVVGHQGWEKNILEKVPYAIVVSFEVLGAEVDIYNPIRITNEIEIQQEIEILKVFDTSPVNSN